LAAALKAWWPYGATLLTTSFGKEFTDKGFSNFMAEKIGEAGLPDRCVTHGLRKAAARRLGRSPMLGKRDRRYHRAPQAERD